MPGSSKHVELEKAFHLAIRIASNEKRAGTGGEKGKRYRAKQSENESVLQVSFFLSAFFRSILLRHLNL
jgi:hypothetical protein